MVLEPGRFKAVRDEGETLPYDSMRIISACESVS